jgi:hypothetical protein
MAGFCLSEVTEARKLAVRFAVMKNMQQHQWNTGRRSGKIGMMISDR